MKVKLYLLGWVIMICSVISAKGQSLKEVVGQAETDTANVYLPADSLFARFLKEKQIPITACNRMTLLKSGRSKFEHLFEDIKKAVELCHLDTFIASLPYGLDEMIADDSDGISQGQKQLLSISRIMLSEPEMLILDEATSSIDTRTEMYIQDAFMHLMEGRTSFIVAHRLQTIKNADLILVIDHGDVVEKGTHKELMAKKGFYHNLYMSQFAKR